MEEKTGRKKAGKVSGKLSEKRPGKTVRLRFAEEEPGDKTIRGAARKGGQAAAAPGRGSGHGGWYGVEGAVKEQTMGRIERQNESDEEDGASRQALRQGKDVGGAVGRRVCRSRYGGKLKRRERAAEPENGAEGANGEARRRQGRAEGERTDSNPLSRWRQKQEIKKRYTAARSAGNTGKSAAAKGPEAPGMRRGKRGP